MNDNSLGIDWSQILGNSRGINLPEFLARTVTIFCGIFWAGVITYKHRAEATSKLSTWDGNQNIDNPRQS